MIILFRTRLLSTAGLTAVQGRVCLCVCVSSKIHYYIIACVYAQWVCWWGGGGGGGTAYIKICGAIVWILFMADEILGGFKS